MAVSGCAKPPPTDAEMIANFEAHREHFEALRSRLCSLNWDQVVMWDPEWARPEMPVAERERYYSIFKAIG
jgi:hypothetical protein